jgi:hypothetical protein
MVKIVKTEQSTLNINQSRRMRSIFYFCLALSSFLVGKTYASITVTSGLVEAIEIHSASAADQNPCEVGVVYIKVGGSWFWFPSTGDDGKNFLPLFETAIGFGKSVTVRATDIQKLCLTSAAPGYKKVAFVTIVP